MLIPNNYLLEEGKEAPEGTVVKTCKFCNKKFAVPASEAEKVKDVCDADACKEALDKEMTEAVHSLMKAPGSTEAAEAVKTAIGN